jgi:hypothetical protein
MKGYPDPKIIVTNEHNNHIFIYRRHEIEITQSTDLISAMRLQISPSLGGKEIIV